jgi:hypothetical protein
MKTIFLCLTAFLIVPALFAAPGKTRDMTSEFREVALDVFDRLSSMPSGPSVPESVYQAKHSEAEVLLSKLRRTASTADERSASEALQLFFWKINFCRTSLAWTTAADYGKCLNEEIDLENSARDALGIESGRVSK